MNDVLATILALGFLYLVVKFAFGGPSSSSTTSATHREPIPAHEQGNVATGHRDTTAGPIGWASGIAGGGSGGGGKRETLISRYGLEGRLASSPSSSSYTTGNNNPTQQGSTMLPNKGKCKMQNDEDWKKGAESRREELKRRKEEMILEARRKMLEKQQHRASLAESSTTTVPPSSSSSLAL